MLVKDSIKMQNFMDLNLLEIATNIKKDTAFIYAEI
jgi:hypothetical protein